MSTGITEQVRDRQLLLALDELSGRDAPPDRVDEIHARREAAPAILDTSYPLLHPGPRSRTPWMAAALVVLGLGATTGIHVLSQRATQDRASWTERGDQQRTGYYPGGLGKTAARPMVFLYKGGATLIALDLLSGKLKWTLRMSPADHSSPLVHGGVVFMGSKTGDLLAVDAPTGRVLWKRKIDATDGYHFDYGQLPVAFFGGVLYCALQRQHDGHKQGRYVAMHAKTGRVLWSFDADGVFAGHVLGAGRVYTVCTDGFVYALDIATGHKDWATDLGIDSPQPPLLQDGRVYVAGNDRVCAVGVAKGTIEWQRHLAGLQYTVCTPSLSMSGDHLYVGETTLYCLRRGDGKIEWSQPGMTLRGAPIVHGDLVIVGNMVWHGDGKVGFLRTGGQKPALVAFDQKTGKIRWKNDQVSDILRDMAVAHGLVCAVSREKKALYAFDVVTGKILWKYDLGRQCLTAPCIADAATVVQVRRNGKDSDR